MSKLGPISHFLSPVSCDSLVLQGLWCEWGAGVLIWCHRSHSLILVTGSSTWHLMAKNSLRIWKKRFVLHKDDIGYKKIAKTLKLSCSTVAKTIQRFNRTGSTQNRPRHGRPKKLSARAQHHIQRLCLVNRHMSAVSIAADVEGVGGGGGQPVSAQTIRCTLHQIGLHGCHPRRKPLLKMMHKKARKKKLITGTIACGLMRPRKTYLVQMVLSVYGGNQVRNTKTSVSCLQSSMVVRVSWSGDAWMLPALGSYSSLREPWMPTRTVTYWSRAWSPPWAAGHWAAGQYSIMIMTTALLKKLRVKVIDWPSMSSDLNPIEHLWGILKRKVEERKVSNIHQPRDVVMEEWKRTPVATCEALVNSMPRRVKSVLENNGGHTKYWHFGPNLDIFI